MHDLSDNNVLESFLGANVQIVVADFCRISNRCLSDLTNVNFNAASILNLTVSCMHELRHFQRKRDMERALNHPVCARSLKSLLTLKTNSRLTYKTQQCVSIVTMLSQLQVSDCM